MVYILYPVYGVTLPLDSRGSPATSRLPRQPAPRFAPVMTVTVAGENSTAAGGGKIHMRAVPCIIRIQIPEFSSAYPLEH